MNVEYLDKLCCLLIRVSSSSFMIKDAKAVINGMNLEVKKRGNNLILLDVTQRSKPKKKTVGFTARKSLTEVVRPPVEVSILASSNVINGLGEDVAVNRGDRCRVFPKRKAGDSIAVAKHQPRTSISAVTGRGDDSFHDL